MPQDDSPTGVRIRVPATMHHLIDNDEILVSVAEGHANTATLCFAGIGHAIGGVAIQSPEFARSTNQSTAIVIIDRKRSWGNNIDFPAVKEAIAPYTNGKTLSSIGNSMGGFLAILATRFFTIETAIAFVPQYSVSKKLIPTESRWDEYVDAIQDWRFESLSGSFNEHTQYYTFFGIGGDDRQRELFPRRSNVHRILFRPQEFDHHCAQSLKERGLLYDVIRDCIAKKAPEALLRESLADLGSLAFVG